MLQDFLVVLGLQQVHWLQRQLGIYHGMHSWMPELCPCWELS